MVGREADPPNPNHRIPLSDSANIARHLPLMAARQPDAVAVKIPRGRTGAGGIDYLTLSFAELDAEVDAWVDRLRSAASNKATARW